MLPDVSAAELSYAGNQFQHRHAHEETTISMVLSGSLVERVGKAEEMARVLSVVVKPGGTEHEDRFSPRGARTLQIRLAPAAAARLRGWQSPVDQWQWLHGCSAVVPFLRLLLVVRENEARSDTVSDVIADAATEVIAALPTHHIERHRGAPRWLELVREEIDDSPARTLRVQVLAHGAQVHPVHLAREFRRHFGVSVSEYMQRRRVQRAATLLIDTRAPLSSVSLDAGYTDQSHFCRIFKRETGLTPRGFRQLVAAPRRASH
jgi:AraC family transcriptional regulator